MGCGPSKAPDVENVVVDGTVLEPGSLPRSKKDSAGEATLSPFDKTPDSFGSTNGIKEGTLQESTVPLDELFGDDEVRIAAITDVVLCASRGMRRGRAARARPAMSKTLHHHE